MATHTSHKPDRDALRRLLDCEQSSTAGLVLRLAWYLGLTRGEIRTLRWQQVDLSAAAVRLPGRSVPVPPEMLSLLAARKAEGSGRPGYVLSNRSGEPFAEQYLSRLARGALDRAGQRHVRLTDLRRDYAVRLLKEHDWQYVSRVTGMELVSLRRHALSQTGTGIVRQKPPGAETPPEIDGDAIARLVEAEGFSPAGTLICLAYGAGLQAGEMRRLTWNQVDFSRSVITLPDRTVTVPADVLSYLAALRERNGGRSDYVVISKRAGKPLEAAYLSKTARAALVSAGIADVTLSGLCSDYIHRTQVEQPVLQLVKERGSVMRSEVARLLHLTGTQTYARLSRMTASGRLVRVGNRYFLPGQTAAPDRHAGLILDYLRAEGSAVRQDLARLLHILPRQVYPILQKLVASGDVVFRQGRYYPAPPPD